jgi:hypothetical protein
MIIRNKKHIQSLDPFTDGRYPVICTGFSPSGWDWAQKVIVTGYGEHGTENLGFRNRRGNLLTS